MENRIKNSRIFITGGSGFIGSHLARHCLSLGARVAVLTTSKDSCWRLVDIIDKIEIFEGSVTKQEELQTCIQKFRPQFVFHLAAILERKLSFDLFEELFEVHVKGTSNLLSILIKSKELERLIHIGTIEEYGRCKAPFGEDQRELPISPYSLTKVMATKMGEYAAQEEKLPVVIVRPSVIYGPAQSFGDFLTPNIIRACIEGENFPMTVGEQTRDFLFVEDLVEGMLKIAMTPDINGEIINLGSGKEISVKEVAMLIRKVVGNPNIIQFGAIPDRANEVANSVFDIHKAQQIIGWKPKTELEDGLTKTVEWYKQNWSIVSRDHESKNKG